MNAIAEPLSWSCKSSWKTSGKNTLWYLLGCSLGNYATIGLFQVFASNAPSWMILLLAPMVGLFSIIALEIIFLATQIPIQKAIKAAFGMSFISMIIMQLVANLMNLLLVGEMRLTWWSILPSLLVGFLSVFPYNYYRIKKYGNSCHL